MQPNTSHPSFGRPVNGPTMNTTAIGSSTIASSSSALENGVGFSSGTLLLEGEKAPLLPAELEVLGARSARLTLHEGRYHQVRRMFAAVGNHVVALHRERIGGLALDGLPPGDWRRLGDDDRARLFAG